MYKESNHSFKSWILFGALMYLLIGNMISVYSSFVPFRDYLKLIITIVGLLVLLRVIDISHLLISNCLFTLFLLMFIIGIGTLYYHSRTASLSWAINQFGEALCWIAVFSLSYRTGLRNPTFIYKIAVPAACFIPVFAILFTSIKVFDAGRGTYAINMSYYALFLMPFALLSKNIVIKWGGVFLVLYTLLLSMKRTGFISFFATIIVYFIISYFQSERHSKKRLLTFISSVVLLSIAIWYVVYSSQDGYSILDRMASIIEDGGMGRTKIWSMTFDMIKQSDIIQKVFGHGFNAVYGYTGNSLSAHNDILETQFDYGLIGLILYIGFYRRLINGCRTIKNESPELFAAFVCSIVMTIPMTLFAHLIIYPTHFLVICYFWGLSMGGIDSGSEQSIYLRY